MEDTQLIRLQAKHRSSTLRGGILQCRHHHVREPGSFMHQILQQTGFYTVSVIDECKVDPALVTAFVERWRPETHTFHLPSGECTITLEDVAIQLGLNINGLPVTGPTYFDWAEECQELLGIVPEPQYMKGFEVKLIWLVKNFYNTPPDASEIQKQRFCRAHILNLIGSCLMPDKSNNRVHLMYLPLLRDLSRVNRYSWGSACLAHLYKELCHATNPDTKGIGGSVLLLQSWIWHRLPMVAPLTDGPPVFPFANKWNRFNITFCSYPHGNLAAIRSRIDHMNMCEFQWMPYRNIMDQLPNDITQNSHVWRSYTPLICFSTVVWHQVDRVKLQFGMVQEIPQLPMNMDELHKIDRRGNHDVNWSHRHAEWITMWGNRHNRIVDGQIINGQPIHSAEYMDWYIRNTILYLSIDQYLNDPRVGRVSNTTPPPTRAQGQPSFDQNSQQLNEEAGVSYQNTPTPHHDFGYHTDQDHSIGTSDSAFYTNLFGVNVGTPQSANAYVQYLTSNQQYQPPEDIPESSGLMQQAEENQQPPQQHEEQVLPDQGRQLPARTRRRRGCGTGSHY